MPVLCHFECASGDGRDLSQSTVSVSPFEAVFTCWRLRSFRFLALAFVLAFAFQMAAQTVEESQVKAAYLYNFAKFVDWPPVILQTTEDPVVICVVGEERTGDALEHSVIGKKAKGRPIHTRRPHSPEEFKSCHILFVGFSDKDHIAKVLREVRSWSVLTVGQSPDFLPLGGMINLAQRDRTIELEIAPEVPKLVGLNVSSQLLLVARVVKTRNAQGVAR